MGTGIAQVWKGNKKGGLAMATGPEHIRGLLEIALGSGDSANPFQDLGLGERMIFEPLDYSTFAPVQDRIREIFAGFESEDLATLSKRSDNLRIYETAEGQAAIQVFMVDLETDDEYALSVSGNVNGLSVTM